MALPSELMRADDDRCRAYCSDVCRFAGDDLDPETLEPRLPDPGGFGCAHPTDCWQSPPAAELSGYSGFAFQMFTRLKTQWNYRGYSGVKSGLRYNEVWEMIDRYRDPGRLGGEAFALDVFERVQTLEDVVLTIQDERLSADAEKNESERANGKTSRRH